MNAILESYRTRYSGKEIAERIEKGYLSPEDIETIVYSKKISRKFKNPAIYKAILSRKGLEENVYLTIFSRLLEKGKADLTDYIHLLEKRLSKTSFIKYLDLAIKETNGNILRYIDLSNPLIDEEILNKIINIDLKVGTFNSKIVLNPNLTSAQLKRILSKYPFGKFVRNAIYRKDLITDGDYLAELIEKDDVYFTELGNNVRQELDIREAITFLLKNYNISEKGLEQIKIFLDLDLLRYETFKDEVVQFILNLHKNKYEEDEENFIINLIYTYKANPKSIIKFLKTAELTNVEKFLEITEFTYQDYLFSFALTINSNLLYHLKGLKISDNLKNKYLNKIREFIKKFPTIEMKKRYENYNEMSDIMNFLAISLPQQEAFELLKELDFFFIDADKKFLEREDIKINREIAEYYFSFFPSSKYIKLIGETELEIPLEELYQLIIIKTKDNIIKTELKNRLLNYFKKAPENKFYLKKYIGFLEPSFEEIEEVINTEGDFEKQFFLLLRILEEYSYFSVDMQEKIYNKLKEISDKSKTHLFISYADRIDEAFLYQKELKKDIKNNIDKFSSSYFFERKFKYTEEIFFKYLEKINTKYDIENTKYHKAFANGEYNKNIYRAIFDKYFFLKNDTINSQTILYTEEIIFKYLF